MLSHVGSGALWNKPILFPGRVLFAPEPVQYGFVLLYFVLFAFWGWIIVSIFFCTALFVSISQMIGCKDRLRNYVDCVWWGIRLF